MRLSLGLSLARLCAAGARHHNDHHIQGYGFHAFNMVGGEFGAYSAPSCSGMPPRPQTPSERPVRWTTCLQPEGQPASGVLALSLWGAGSAKLPTAAILRALRTAQHTGSSFHRSPPSESSLPPSDRQTRFIEISIEAGILPSGKGTIHASAGLRTVVVDTTHMPMGGCAV